MPKFYYQAKDRKGVVVDGAIRAENKWLARKSLNKLNLIVLEVNRFNLKIMIEELKAWVERTTQRVSMEELMVLLSQMETAISVGIPVVQMLHLLQKDLKNKYLKKTLEEISEDITQGGTLHAAFAKHRTIFDPTVTGLLKTGEVSGKLEETLGRITQMIDQQAKNRAKVKSAVFYPKIVVFVMVVVLFVLVYFIIPKLKDFLAGLGTDLPPITQFVVGTSNFFVSYWYLMLALGFGIRYFFNRWTSTPQGKMAFDRFKLKLPLFGTIFIHLELNNFCVILELMISSGLSLMEALETLKESQRNEVFKEALAKCQAEIAKGGSLIQGMEGSEVFPSTFTNLLGIGEEAGRLVPVLQRLGRYYQIQIDYQLDNLSKLIEPVLLFIIFGMVLVIALAVMLPIWKMSSSMRPKF